MSTTECKKDTEDPNATYCYECDLSPVHHPASAPGLYLDCGCMTAAQWATVRFTDAAGNLELDKKKYCRKR